MFLPARTTLTLCSICLLRKDTYTPFFAPSTFVFSTYAIAYLDVLHPMDYSKYSRCKLAVCLASRRVELQPFVFVSGSPSHMRVHRYLVTSTRLPVLVRLRAASPVDAAHSDHVATSRKLHFSVHYVEFYLRHFHWPFHDQPTRSSLPRKRDW